jgi:hypothetical protein
MAAADVVGKAVPFMLPLRPEVKAFCAVAETLLSPVRLRTRLADDERDMLDVHAND